MRHWQVTTIICAVLVEAAYMYGAPMPSYSLPNNQQQHGSIKGFQPQRLHISQENHEENKLISYSTHNDNPYGKNGNLPNNIANNYQFPRNYNDLKAPGYTDSGWSNPARIISSQNLPNSRSINSNNGYKEYKYSWKPETSLNNGYDQITTGSVIRKYPQNSWTPVNNIEASNGYSQTLPLINTNNLNTGHQQSNHLSSYQSYNNDQSSVSNLNAVHYNNGILPVLLAQGSNNNINNNNNQGSLSSANYNTEYSQTGRFNDPLNNGHIQGFQPNTDLNNRFSQFAQISTTDYNIKHDTTLVQNLPLPNDISKDNLAQNNQNAERSVIPGNNLDNLQVVRPIIHKHVYFHVPPPEIEESAPILAPQPSPRKKDFKILFIKVPSQTSKLNVERLQQQMALAAALEEKTLIYVLVKKQEDPKPIILSAPKTSQHQVFFVKYNGDPFDIASQVNDELDETGSIKSIVPLAPGLVNGRQRK